MFVYVFAYLFVYIYVYVHFLFVCTHISYCSDVDFVATFLCDDVCSFRDIPVAISILIFLSR